ncbi:hypothetical protein QBC46DRAFT_372236 [Diplogelasinospora grovesii]|uniref:Uncharacterized protein n=1 Tax=Diplogelasinospora grovesii TaxID=303347 RepID=A0AAN6S9Y0_9PEZI|nr:hypothetical protein QBC46DRAFT_372236 [Diplogelasinospora grovesii]
MSTSLVQLRAISRVLPRRCGHALQIQSQLQGRIQTAAARTWRQQNQALLRRHASSSPQPSSTGSAGPKTSSSQQAGAGKTGQLAYPEKLVIFHAGTGKITFLACLKLTTLFSVVFFTAIVAPSYVQSDDELALLKTAGVVACGIVPALFVAWSTGPFVTTIRLHLPPFARVSEEALRRFGRTHQTASTGSTLDIVTLSLIGRPRMVSVPLADLKPTNARLGMVNYTTSSSATKGKGQKGEKKQFNIQPGNNSLKNGWLWRDIAEAIDRRAVQTSKK